MHISSMAYNSGRKLQIHIATNQVAITTECLNSFYASVHYSLTLSPSAYKANFNTISQIFPTLESLLSSELHSKTKTGSGSYMLKVFAFSSFLSFSVVVPSHVPSSRLSLLLIHSSVHVKHLQMVLTLPQLMFSMAISRKKK